MISEILSSFLNLRFPFSAYFCIMKLFTAFVFIIIIITSCSPAAKFRKDKTAFDASKTIQSFKAVADMNDSYFELKENNFFEFYRQLFDSVKNTSFPGKYSMKGDTIVLKFYDQKGGELLLGSKAIIHENKKEIVFFK